MNCEKTRIIKVDRCFRGSCYDDKFSNLYDAVESLKGQVLIDNTVIKINPGCYSGVTNGEKICPINIENIVTSNPNQLILIGDTREIVGTSYINGIPMVVGANEIVDSTPQILLSKCSIIFNLFKDVDGKTINVFSFDKTGLKKNDRIGLAFNNARHTLYEELKIKNVDKNTIYLKTAISDDMLGYNQRIGLTLTILPNVIVELARTDKITLDNTFMNISTSCKLQGIYLKFIERIQKARPRVIKTGLNISRCNVETKNLVLGTTNWLTGVILNLTNYSSFNMSDSNNSLMNLYALNINSSNFISISSSILSHWVGVYIPTSSNGGKTIIEKSMLSTTTTGNIQQSVISLRNTSLQFNFNSIFSPSSNYYWFVYPQEISYVSVYENKFFNIPKIPMMFPPKNEQGGPFYFGEENENVFIVENKIEITFPTEIKKGVPFDIIYSLHNDTVIPLNYNVDIYYGYENFTNVNDGIKLVDPGVKTFVYKNAVINEEIKDSSKKASINVSTNVRKQTEISVPYIN